MRKCFILFQDFAKEESDNIINDIKEPESPVQM